jgi:hypothetical protein
VWEMPDGTFLIEQEHGDDIRCRLDPDGSIVGL